MKTQQMFFVVALICAGGCIALPIPHTRTAYPEIAGRISFPENQQELQQIRYEMRVDKDKARKDALIIDRHGGFNIPEEREWAWWFFIPLLPIDCGYWVDLKLVSADRVIYHSNKMAFPVDMNLLHIRKFDFGLIQIDPGPGYEDDDDGRFSIEKQ